VPPGPQVPATVALCTGSYRLSKRTTQQVMADLFGVPMRVGTISQSEQATTTVVVEPVEAARASVAYRKATQPDMGLAAVAEGLEFTKRTGERAWEMAGGANPGGVNRGQQTATAYGGVSGCSRKD
jgi:hypothetical protein